MLPILDGLEKDIPCQSISFLGFPGVSSGKDSMQDTWVKSLGRKDPLEQEMATYSSILAWEIPWTEETGRLQSTGVQRVRHDWVTEHTHGPRPRGLWARAWRIGQEHPQKRGGAERWACSRGRRQDRVCSYGWSKPVRSRKRGRAKSPRTLPGSLRVWTLVWTTQSPGGF